MSSLATIVAGWFQFAIAAAILLLIGRLAMRWVTKPVERIRVIQATLAAVLAVPILIASAPWPAWRVGLVVVNERVADEAGYDASDALTAGAAVPPSGAPLKESGYTLSDAASSAVGEPLPNSLPSAALRGSRSRWRWWTTFGACLVVVHSLAILFFLIEWGIGALRLRRLACGAAAPLALVRDTWESVTEGRGGHVQLLVSPSLDTPLTFGWRRPVIAVPRALADGDARVMRYCLAHEWSHIERGDMLSWLGVEACRLLLWCQPLFWSLRREIRICQDILADDRATRGGRDGVEYSRLLLGFATKRATAPLSGALTIFDHPSQLTRRIKALLQPPQSLRSRCTWKFSVGIAMAALVSATLISGVRLDSAKGDEAGKKPRAVAEKANVDVGNVGTANNKSEGSKKGAGARKPTADSWYGASPGQERDDNELKMKLVWCPAGTFTMGSPESEFGRAEGERQVEVTLTKGFWLGKYEVTQSEWKQVMLSEPWKGEKQTKVGDDYPATFVSWEDAMEFCCKLTTREREARRIPDAWEYTLPTEAQWERACRALTETTFSFGNDESEVGEYAWFLDNTIKAAEIYAHRVGQKKTNPWGLCDMHGNATEWCRDCYGSLPLPGGRDPEGGETRVVRGGSWLLTARRCRSAGRTGIIATPSARTSDFGFRVACTRPFPGAQR